MYNSLKIFKKSQFLKNTLIVMLGVGITQIISIAIMPILTRQYSVDTLGVVANFTSIVGILAAFITLRYNMAIVMPKKDVEVKYILQNTSFFIFLNSILVFSLFLLINIFYEVFLEFQIYVFLLIYLISQGFNNIIEYRLTRNKLFYLYTKIIVSTALISACFKLILGYFSPNLSSLIIGYTLNVFLIALFGFSSIKKDVFSFSLKNINKNKYLLSKYIKFPKYRVLNDTINSLSQNAPVLLLTFFFNPKVAGFYWLSMMVVKSPVALISQAVRKVFFQKTTEIINNNKNLRLEIIKTISIMSLLSFFPYFFIFLFGENIFIFIFGEQWVDSGFFSKWLSIWLFFSFISVPAIASVPVLNLEKQLLKYEIISSVLRVCSLILGAAYFKNYNYSIIGFSIVGSLCTIFIILYVLYKASFNNYFKY